jgi:hypothetical protein
LVQAAVKSSADQRINKDFDCRQLCTENTPPSSASSTIFKVEKSLFQDDDFDEPEEAEDNTPYKGLKVRLNLANNEVMIGDGFPFPREFKLAKAHSTMENTQKKEDNLALAKLTLSKAHSDSFGIAPEIFKPIPHRALSNEIKQTVTSAFSSAFQPKVRTVLSEQRNLINRPDLVNTLMINGPSQRQPLQHISSEQIKKAIGWTDNEMTIGLLTK